MQTMVLKKTHENSHFLTSEFHSGCKNTASANKTASADTDDDALC